MAGFPGQVLHGSDRILLTATAKHNLRHHYRNTNRRNTQQVNQYKSTPAIFTGNIGKFPNVTQTDCGTGCSQNKHQS